MLPGWSHCQDQQFIMLKIMLYSCPTQAHLQDQQQPVHAASRTSEWGEAVAQGEFACLRVAEWRR